MKIINASVEVLDQINGEEILKHIEKIGRVCYKSEDKITTESSKKFVTDLIKRGHEAVIEHFNISVKFICDRGCCYDDKTKVLTDNGWKLFKDVSIEKDSFYTLNDNEDIIKLKANKLINIPYSGKMHYYDSSQINLAVTPNHNMWVYDYDKRSDKTRKWKFIKSEDMNNRRYKFNKSANPLNKISDEYFTINGINIPRGFYTETVPELKFNANLFFELVGWWITDGSINYGINGSGNRLIISQTKKIGRQRIKELLEILNIKYLEYKNEFRINCPQLLNWLSNNFLKDSDTKKTYYCSIPRWFFTELSSNNLESFLNGVIGGDGTKHTKSNGYQIYTASKQFAGDLVELALNVGKSANVYEVKERTRTFPNQAISNCQKQYVVSIVTTNKVLFDKRTAIKEEIEYNGNVYCVELPQYHRLYVMREGKACWCGNSHEIVRHRIASYAQESTRYCNYSKDKFGSEITVIKPLFWQENSPQYQAWRIGCVEAEIAYFELLSLGATAQEARSVLPNSLKTEIVVTMNLRELRHFFRLRTANAAHPQMREVSIPLLNKLKTLIPVIFDDIEVE